LVYAAIVWRRSLRIEISARRAGTTEEPMSDETTDQDTEGQKFKPTELMPQRAVDDDTDTEGQKFKPTELMPQRSVDDEDTEGQKMKPTEFAQRAVDDDEDTEGHSQSRV